jgi:putative tryptophan/tyrosine transport system substrate-binding protein
MAAFMQHLDSWRGGFCRRWVRLLVACISLASLSTFAADQTKLPTIGELWLSDPVTAALYMKEFRHGLRELGYVEGHTITIVSRFARGDPARLPGLVRELVASKVDVLFVTPRAQADAIQATTTIPIVAMGFSDPIAEGAVSSLARPGRNITGISWQSADIVGKRLELAGQLVPGLKRVAVLFDPSDQRGRSAEAKAIEALAHNMGVKTQTFQLSDPSTKQSVFDAISRYQPDVLVVVASSLTLVLGGPIYRFAASRHIPTISETIVMANWGALLTYGADDLAMTQRAAAYVDKILKGAKPADLPIEQPTKFELVVNLKTAKSLGMSIPDSILLRADQIIR